jgi:hypothetical protein
MFPDRLKRLPRRWLLIPAALVALYAALGFGAVPWFAKREIPAFAQQKLGRIAAIDSIEFNPFTLRLRATGFSLKESTGEPIAAFGELVADLEWVSLIGRAWRLAEARLVEPAIALDIAPDGRVNLVALADALTRDKPRSDGPPPPVVIEQLAIERGRFEFSDRRENYRTAFEGIAFRFDRLSTLPDEKGPYAFVATTLRGGTIRWKGDASLNPLAVAGTLVAEKLALAPLTPYIDNFVRAEIRSGTFGMELPLKLAWKDGALAFTTVAARFGIDDLQVGTPGSAEHAVALPGIALTGVGIDLAARTFSAAGLTLAPGGRIAIARGKDGALDFPRPATASAPTPSHPASAPTPSHPASAPTPPLPASAPASPSSASATPASAQPWRAVVEVIELGEFAAAFRDASTRQPGLADLRGLTAKLRAEVTASTEATAVKLSGGEIGVASLRLGPANAKDTAVALSALRIAGIEIDSGSATATVDEVTLGKSALRVARDAAGRIDLLDLLGGGPASVARAAPTVPPPAPKSAPEWKTSLRRVTLQDVSATWRDAASTSPTVATVSGLKARAAIDAVTGADDARVKLAGGEIGIAELRVGIDGQTDPVARATNLAANGIGLDLAASTLAVERVSVGALVARVVADAGGRLNILALIPNAKEPTSATGKPAAPTAAAGTRPFSARIAAFDLADGSVSYRDDTNRVENAIERIRVRATDVSTDPKRPIGFDVSAAVKSGGDIAAKGRFEPAGPAVDARVRVAGLSILPAQPFVTPYAKLAIISGAVSADGALRWDAKGGRLAYTGSAGVNDVLVNETDGGERFITLKSLATDTLRLSLGPDRLDIDEMRIVEPSGKLLIGADGKSNLSKVTTAAPNTPSPAAASTASSPAAPFPVAVKRLRVERAYLDFADLSLRPQFGARIHELTGVITGISTDRATRSHLELEGRVDEFGLARINGDINPFVPRENTDVTMAFRNVDLTTASPYSMKFAGYRVASGRLTANLHYRVKSGNLDATNKVILDQFTLGERVDSPDAVKLPLELAIAILKDSDGRIDLELPISGSIDDPQFSYGAIVWKAITNVLTRIVTAPFRALGALFGGGEDKLDAIEFDPGSARLLPPEREKLGRIAKALEKRPQLKLQVTGQYHTEADGAALRATALRAEIARRSGQKVAAGESPGPYDLQDRATRSTLRALFAERTSEAELDRLKAEAEKQAGVAPKEGEKPASVGLLQRAMNLARSEPQVANPEPFYRDLIARLADRQPLDKDALAELGRRRGAEIAQALQGTGVDAARLAPQAPEGLAGGATKAVPAKLGLAAK